MTRGDVRRARIRFLINPTSNQVRIYLPLFSALALGVFPRSPNTTEFSFRWGFRSPLLGREHEGRPRETHRPGQSTRPRSRTWRILLSRPPSPTGSLSDLLLRVRFIHLYISVCCALIDHRRNFVGNPLETFHLIVIRSAKWIGTGRPGDRYYDGHLWFYVVYVRRADTWNAAFIVRLRAAPLSDSATSFLPAVASANREATYRDVFTFNVCL